MEQSTQGLPLSRWTRQFLPGWFSLVWFGLVASQLDGSTQQPVSLVTHNKQTRH
jgi:hypothetical protein